MTLPAQRKKTTKIVFLFPTIKKSFTPKYFFTFNGQRLSRYERLRHPMAKVSASLDWEGAMAGELADTVYPSTLMRSLMQAELVARYAPDGFEVLSTNVPHISDSIVILNKFLINKRLLLHYLKLRGNIILADMVDGRFKLDKRLNLVDGLICCSHKGLAHYSTAQSAVPVFFVEHCTDPRLPEVSPLKEFSPWYFGAPQNLLMYDSLKGRINISLTEIDKKPHADWLADLPKANFHYALRPEIKEYSFKPFTKGFVAAHCNANILVHKEDGDARFYLGDDYPYLIHEKLNEEVIKTYLAKARDDFGGERWHYGLSIMAKLREKQSEKAISEAFWGMVNTVA